MLDLLEQRMTLSEEVCCLREELEHAQKQLKLKLNSNDGDKEIISDTTMQKSPSKLREVSSPRAKTDIQTSPSRLSRSVRTADNLSPPQSDTSTDSGTSRQSNSRMQSSVTSAGSASSLPTIVKQSIQDTLQRGIICIEDRRRRGRGWQYLVRMVDDDSKGKGSIWVSRIELRKNNRRGGSLGGKASARLMLLVSARVFESIFTCPLPLHLLPEWKLLFSDSNGSRSDHTE